MRLHFARLHFLLIPMLFCGGVCAAAQTPPPAALTCAELHLVPAPRECSAVTAIPTSTTGL